MIPHGVEIFIGLDPIDLRWGFERLEGVVRERLGRDARGAALFVFLGRRRSAIKVFFCDDTGVCIFYKRLNKGTFRLPQVDDANATVIQVEERLLDTLLDGVDVIEPKPRPSKKAIVLH